MVAASRYSLGSFEETIGRRGFEHALDQQPVLGERVDVTAQRTMDERDEHVLLHLLVALLLDEVRTDSPVLLGRVEHMVIDPSAVRSLQQRMVQEEAESSARLQHSGHLGDRLVDVADVLEDETRHNGVEAGVGERQRRGLAASKRCAAPFARRR